MLNDVFEIDNVGYRIIGKQISPITNETEIQSIESALALSGPFSGARIHIQTALEKYSDKTDPDYRNCVKESISAVESMCQILADNPKATLGAALKVLNNSGIDIHSALAAGFEKIYGLYQRPGRHPSRHLGREQNRRSGGRAVYACVLQRLL